MFKQTIKIVLEKIGNLYWGVSAKRHSLRSPFIIIYLIIIIVYLLLLIGPYYARPIPSDFLSYTRQACTNSFEQFQGAISERLTVLLTIRSFNSFIPSPADAGMVSLIVVNLLIVACVIYIAHRYGGPIAGVLAGCLLAFTTTAMLLFGTELHADQYGVLLLIISFLLAMEFFGRSNRVKHLLSLLVGISLMLLVGTKLNFIIFIPLFALPLLVSRQRKYLLTLLAGLFGGLLILSGWLIFLYPKVIWANYIAAFISSLPNYSDPHPARSIYWFQHITSHFYVILLYLFVLFRRSYRSPAVKESFSIGLFYFLSLALGAAINERMATSVVYSFAFVVPLVIGAALVIARELKIRTDKFSWRPFLLSFIILILFFLGVKLGIKSAPQFATVESQMVTVFLYAVTPLLGIALTAWLLSFNGGRLAALSLILVLALPQTLLINAYSYDRFVKTNRDWEKPFYAFADRIGPEFLGDSPVFIYLSKIELAGNEYRYRIILENKLSPTPSITLLRGDEEVLDDFIFKGPKGGNVVLDKRFGAPTIKGIKKYNSIITDSPELINKKIPNSYINQVIPAYTEWSTPPLYFMKISETKPSMDNSELIQLKQYFEDKLSKGELLPLPTEPSYTIKIGEKPIARQGEFLDPDSGNKYLYSTTVDRRQYQIQFASENRFYVLGNYSPDPMKPPSILIARIKTLDALDGKIDKSIDLNRVGDIKYLSSSHIPGEEEILVPSASYVSRWEPPIGYWDFNRSINQKTILDLSGNNNNIDGSKLKFKTIDNIRGVDISDKSLTYFQGTDGELDQITMGIWVLFTKLPDSKELHETTIFGYKNFLCTLTYVNGGGHNNEIYGYIGGGGSHVVSPGNIVKTSTWYLINLVFDGSQIKLFVNGVRVAKGQSRYQSEIPIKTFTSYADPLKQLEYIVSAAAIYPVALTDGEIYQYYISQQNNQ